MIYWFLIFIIFVTFSIITPRRYTFLIWFIFAFLFGFRYKIGTDYNSYVEIFEHIQNYGYYPVEFGFVFFVRVTQLLGLNYQFMFFLCFLLTLINYYYGGKYLFKKLNMNNYFPFFFPVVLLILGFLTMTSLRQCLALSFCFLALRFIIEKKYLSYVVVILVASTFHVSSILFLLFAPFSNMSFNRWFILVFMLVCLVFAFVSPMPYIGKVLAFLNVSYARFFVSEFHNMHAASLGKSVIISIFAIIMSFSFLFLDACNRVRRLLVLYSMLFVIFQVLSIHMEVVSRASNLMKPIVCVYLILLLKELVPLTHRNNFLVGYIISLTLLSGILLSYYSLSAKNYSFDHLTFNFSLYGKPNIINIYGDHSYLSPRH
jgi:hypothetical protein